MKTNLTPIFLREIRTLFWSPIAYLVLGVFTFISSFFWASVVAAYSQYSINMMQRGQMQGGMKLMEWLFAPFWGNLMITFLFLLPLVSMRAFSEEKNRGTIEMLFTYPFSDLDILLGKYLAQLAFAGVMLATCLLAPVSVLGLTQPQWWVIFSGLLGLFLVMASFLALGTLTSALSENQVVAAALGFGALLLLFVINWASQSVGGTLGTVLTELAVSSHFESLAKGLINLKDLSYFIFFIAFCLFTTLRVLESKKWR
jgi:ABC-2 type transport system permease protein